MNSNVEVSVQPIIGKLEKVFDDFNGTLFKGELKKCIISLIPSKGKYYGWCTLGRIWKDTNGGDVAYYEINITPEFLSRTFHETCCTMIHEMVHLKNIQDDVKDCSNGGRYHNKKFKESAEAVGLVVEKSARFGWSTTSLGDELKSYLTENYPEDIIPVYRSDVEKPKRKSKKVYRFVCPYCGIKASSTQNISIVCMDCGVPMGCVNED